MEYNDLKNLKFNVFGHNSSIKGEFNLHGDVTVSSTIEGQINMLDNGRITIEREGLFEGMLFCHDIEIFGEVKGHIKAEGKVTIRSSAKVSGNVQAQNLIVYPGAILNLEGHTKEL